MDVGFSGRALSNLCPIGLCANAGGAGSFGGEIAAAPSERVIRARLILYIPTKHENPHTRTLNEEVYPQLKAACAAAKTGC